MYLYNLVLYHTFPDGTRVAGEIDLLSIDKDGKIRIYDVKTGKNYEKGFYTYFDSKGDNFRMSTRNYYTLQLSAYKVLFESQYNNPISSLGVIPFAINYGKDGNVETLVGEKATTLAYNPSVMKLLYNTETPKVTPTASPSSEIKAEDRLGEDYKIPEGVKGKYAIDGKVYESYIAPFTTIDGIEVRLARVPNERTQLNYNDPKLSVTSYDYYIVLPNGRAVQLSEKSDILIPINNVKNEILTSLNKNKARVMELASEETPLSKPITAPVVKSDNPVVTPTTNSATKSTGRNTRLGSRLSNLKVNDGEFASGYNPEDVQVSFRRKNYSYGRKYSLL